jgi:hypothetical protein
MSETKITTVQLTRELIDKIKDEKIKVWNINLITIEQKIAYFYDLYKQKNI